MDILNKISEIGVDVKTFNNFADVIKLLIESVKNTKGIGEKTLIKIEQNIEEELISLKEKQISESEINKLKSIENGLADTKFDDISCLLNSLDKNNDKNIIIDCFNTDKLNLLTNIFITLSENELVNVRFEFNDPTYINSEYKIVDDKKRYINVQYSDNIIYYFYDPITKKEFLKLKGGDELGNVVDIDKIILGLKKVYDLKNFNEKIEPEVFYKQNYK